MLSPREHFGRVLRSRAASALVAFLLFGPLFCPLSSCAVDDPPPTASTGCAEAIARPNALVVGGSGACLEPFRELAGVWGGSMRQLHGLDIVVPGSIGTGGAIRALRDGAIDVGLGSRPLKPSELGPDIREVPLFRAPLVFAINSPAAPHPVTIDELIAVLSGVERTWRDGRPAIVIHREPGDSGLAALRERAPAIADAFDAGRADGVIAYTDADAAELLRGLEGAIALTDPTPFRSEPRIHALPIEGPDAEALADLVRVYTAIVREPIEAPVATFLGMLDDPQSRALLDDLGYRFGAAP